MSQPLPSPLPSPVGASRLRPLLLGAGLLFTVGCGDDSCPEGYTCVPNDAGGAGGGTGATGTGGTGAGGNEMGGGGAGGGLPASCSPTEGMPIGADCGVFVKAGATGSGTQAMPFGSILDATAGLGTAKAIYVCGADSFNGSVTLPGGVSLFGGLDCATWSYAASNPKPEIAGDADVPALTITGSGNADVQSINVHAPNAVAAGASSIALLVDGSTISVDNVELVAGNGAAGAPPPAQVAQLNQATGGAMGAAAGSTPSNAAGGTNTCGMTMLAGGSGGAGGLAPNNSGGSGGIGDLGNGGGAGIGQVGAGLNCSVGPGLGGGASGNFGNNGNSSLGASIAGTLNSSGFTPAMGETGLAGSPGQSGGGGGASKATAATNGAGGGGGGAGGCGGTGGPGGAGAGSSLALVSLNATVTMTAQVNLKVGSGGVGGAGGLGQFGQPGGGPGAGGAAGGGVVIACFGGSGGTGGTGGNGGGGRGGHAVAIAYVGTEPQGGTTDLTAATPGLGGLGGDNGVTPAGGTGTDGLLAARQAF